MSKIKPGQEFYRELRAGFVRQGISFRTYCLNNGMSYQNGAKYAQGWVTDKETQEKARIFNEKAALAAGLTSPRKGVSHES